MKSVIWIVIIILFASPDLKSQSIQWRDTIRYGEVNLVVDLEKDSLGYIYASGSFEPVYHGNGNAGVYISKYDSLGNILWSDTSVSTAPYGAGCRGMATDKGGNSYLVGIFSANIKFGSFLLSPSGGYGNYFFVKYNSYGTVVWAKQITNSAGYLDVAINTQGYIYLAGQCYGTNLDSFNVAGPGFVAKFTPAGNCIGASSFSNMFEHIASTINADLFLYENNNALYATLYLKKIDANLNPYWTTQIQGGIKIKTDPIGNCYCMATDAVTKVNSSGVPQWTVTANPSDSLSFFGIYCEANAVHLTGFKGRYQSNTLHALYINNYDSAGNFVSGANYCNDINGTAILPAYGNFYVGGNSLGEGCAAFLLKTGNATSVITLFANNNFCSVYPNPAPGIFELHYNCEQGGNIQLNIYDSQGQLVFKELPSQFNDVYHKKIDLSRQAKGIYFVEIVSAGGKVVKKIVLE